jgi:hypothetical protein
MASICGYGKPSYGAPHIQTVALLDNQRITLIG